MHKMIPLPNNKYKIKKKMKLYKKSQSIGRHVILMWIIVLAVLIAMVLMIEQARDVMMKIINDVFS